MSASAPRGQCSLGLEPEHPRRGSTHQIDESIERDQPVVPGVDHERQLVLEAGGPGMGRPGVLPPDLFLFAGVRGVIGGDHVDSAVLQRLPHGLAVMVGYLIGQDVGTLLVDV